MWENSRGMLAGLKKVCGMEPGFISMTYQIFFTQYFEKKNGFRDPPILEIKEKTVEITCLVPL